MGNDIQDLSGKVSHDHIHVFISYHPHQHVSKIVQWLKGTSSRVLFEEGVTILLVEQNARLALSIADHGYVMENGRIVLDDQVDKLEANADIKEFYLSLTEVGGEEELSGSEAL
jgi:REP element-mobilizing transposase RayT